MNARKLIISGLFALVIMLPLTACDEYPKTDDTAYCAENPYSGPCSDDPDERESQAKELEVMCEAIKEQGGDCW
jgi:hypothetical protein